MPLHLFLFVLSFLCFLVACLFGLFIYSKVDTDEGSEPGVVHHIWVLLSFFCMSLFFMCIGDGWMHLSGCVYVCMYLISNDVKISICCLQFMC